MKWRPPDFKVTHRNPRPARGDGILSLDQLRYYVRRFWTEREFGVCHIHGGKEAFLRFCGEPLCDHVRLKILDDPPKSDWLSKAMQRQLSRKVHQVLRGEIIFVPDSAGSGQTATFKPLMGTPQPPIPDLVPFQDHHFRIEWTAIGPRLRRL